MLKTVVTAVAALSLSASVAFAACPTGTYQINGACTKPTPEQGLKLLLDGNAKYVKGDLTSLVNYSKAAVRTEVAAGQKPFAIVLTCSDSRVPAEILFNKGLGEIFVVRVAGNIVAPHELGSIEYGLEHLGANLIVVLGHERCGAVKSTYGAYPADVEGNIGSLVADIKPAVTAVVGTNAKPAVGSAEETAVIEECIVENIKMVAEQLLAKSPIIEDLVDVKHEVKIVRAKYDLDSGLIKVLESH